MFFYRRRIVTAEQQLQKLRKDVEVLRAKTEELKKRNARVEGWIVLLGGRCGKKKETTGVVK